MDTQIKDWYENQIELLELFVDEAHPEVRTDLLVALMQEQIRKIRDLELMLTKV